MWARKMAISKPNRDAYFIAFKGHVSHANLGLVNGD
jgi:hypothetical protein